MSHKNTREFENRDNERADDCNESQLQTLRIEETNQQTIVPTSIMESLQNQAAVGNLVSNSRAINVYSLNVGKLYFFFQSSKTI